MTIANGAGFEECGFGLVVDVFLLELLFGFVLLLEDVEQGCHRYDYTKCGNEIVEWLPLYAIYCATINETAICIPMEEQG